MGKKKLTYTAVSRAKTDLRLLIASNLFPDNALEFYSAGVYPRDHFEPVFGEMDTLKAMVARYDYLLGVIGELRGCFEINVGSQLPSEFYLPLEQGAVNEVSRFTPATVADYDSDIPF